MRRKFLTSLVARALVITVAAGGGLLVGGTAEATPLPPHPPRSCTLNIGNAVAGSATTTVLLAPTRGLSAEVPVVLVAIVTPCSAKGTVQFKDGDTNLGAPVTVLGGVAFTIAPALTAGPHTLVATFSPTDGPFTSSTSAPLSLTVSAPITAGLPFILGLLLGGHPGIGANVDLAQLIQLLHGWQSDGLTDSNLKKFVDLLHNGQPSSADPVSVLQSLFGEGVNVTGDRLR